ncbi:hypothetical protein JQ633_12485 [Bradyrhizobium tropiciagri]|uniref:hypothetical protein n=1 Tax=Bradyrhizobium tropiciagri TaxID=312253 RepID=UPI001BA7C9F5|nr:hypothetical protein [Bradyrhizobium tropiciagri]MBR0871180.1 hypothetical protein [Bradyrhizobium tropiciagri]
MNGPSHRILEVLSRYRMPLTDEKALQVEIAKVLMSCDLPHQREVDLGGGDIVDFMVLRPGLSLQKGTAPGVAIEVKIGGSRRAIFRQLERYCAHDAVEEIILATAVYMGLPETIGGKPAHVLPLGRAWL